MNLTPVQARVLGSLMEKEVTVPGTYPLTMNALLSACNQTSGREPPMELDRWPAEEALTELKALGLVRLVHASHGARTVKYRQVLDEALGLDPGERAVLTVLLLRGPQTPGELRSRTERLHAFATSDEVEAVLGRLVGRDEPLVALLERRPGQKEARWGDLLAPRPDPDRAPAAAAPATIPPEVAALAPLVGTWRGAGAGEYPTIEDFAYTEEIDLAPVPGKAVLAYRSRTQAAGDGRALHGEAGWLRLVADDRVELVVAQGPGLVEIAEGPLEADGDGGLEILLTSTLVGGTTTAKEVTATERRYSVGGDHLHMELAMAAVGQPVTHHLRARLHRA